MYQVIIAIHVLLGLGIIGLVMMQQGKGADAGASFGSGSAGSVFGAQGAASFLSRTTAILATLFFITSLSLAVINGHKGSTSDIMATPVTTDKPVVPAAAPDAPPPAADVPVSGADDVVKPPSISQTATEVKPEAPVTEAPKTETAPVTAAPVVPPVTPAKNEAKVETIEVPKAEPIKAVEETPKNEEKHQEKAHSKSSKHKSSKKDKSDKH